MPQDTHKLLLIPGPIELADEVLQANSHPSVSHMSLEFARVFRESIKMTREVLDTYDGQPFLIAGSGTLCWDQVAANLVEPGENVLVLNCGFFAEGFIECLETYGGKVDVLRPAQVGGTVKLSDIEAALKHKKYKLITATHVDTSTAVLTDIKAIGELVQDVSPATVFVVDGICSIASEEIRMDAWLIDVVLGASQKGLGAPPGLSIVVAGRKALKGCPSCHSFVLENRETPVRAHYASWKKWLPVMQAYERNNPAYFATPPVNLIYAYRASLAQITKGPISLQDRYQAHKNARRRLSKVAEDLGFKNVPLSEEITANSMSALYFPEGLHTSDILPYLLNKDIVVSASILPSIKDKYFRVGHMGVSVVDPARDDIDRISKALAGAIEEAKGVRARY